MVVLKTAVNTLKVIHRKLLANKPFSYNYKQQSFVIEIEGFSYFNYHIKQLMADQYLDCRVTSMTI